MIASQDLSHCVNNPLPPKYKKQKLTAEEVRMHENRKRLANIVEQE